MPKVNATAMPGPRSDSSKFCVHPPPSCPFPPLICCVIMRQGWPCSKHRSHYVFQEAPWRIYCAHVPAPLPCPTGQHLATQSHYCSFVSHPYPVPYFFFLCHSSPGGLRDIQNDNNSFQIPRHQNAPFLLSPLDIYDCQQLFQECEN